MKVTEECALSRGRNQNAECMKIIGAHCPAALVLNITAWFYKAIYIFSYLSPSWSHTFSFWHGYTHSQCLQKQYIDTSLILKCKWYVFQLCLHRHRFFCNCGCVLLTKPPPAGAHNVLHPLSLNAFVYHFLLLPHQPAKYFTKVICGAIKIISYIYLCIYVYSICTCCYTVAITILFSFRDQ